MIHEEKKIGKIVEELTMFFFSVGSEKMSSGIEKEQDGVKITFCADYLPEYEHSIEKLEQYLNAEKNEGIEDCYWELAGSGDPGETSQLLLVGMMIDKFKVNKKANQIELTLYRKA